MKNKNIIFRLLVTMLLWNNIICAMTESKTETPVAATVELATYGLWQAKSVKEAQICLNDGANINAIYLGRTFLHHFVESHQGSEIELIMWAYKHGVDSGAVDSRGMTALGELVCYQFPKEQNMAGVGVELAKLLIAIGVPVLTKATVGTYRGSTVLQVLKYRIMVIDNMKFAKLPYEKYQWQLMLKAIQDAIEKIKEQDGRIRSELDPFLVSGPRDIVMEYYGAEKFPTTAQELAADEVETTAVCKMLAKREEEERNGGYIMGGCAP